MWNLIKILPIISALWLLRGIAAAGDVAAAAAAAQSPQDGYRISILINDTQMRVGEINFYREYELSSNSSAAATIVIKGSEAVWSKHFGIIQVHSYLRPVTLSANNTLGDASEKFYVNGTNIGFNVHRNSTFYLHSLHPQNGTFNTSVAVAFILYRSTGAIPGGCNMVHPVDETPFLSVMLEEEIVLVETPPAGSGVPHLDNTTCTTENFLYEFRYLYLTKQDFSKALVLRYATHIDAMESGYLVTKVPEYNLHQYYAKNTGMGIFFVTLVMDGYGENVTTAYIPGHSYGCPQQQLFRDCHVIDSTPLAILLVLMMVMGACLIILGRQLVYLRIIVNSFMIGGYLAYVIFCTIEDWDLKMVIVMLGGLIFAIAWTVLWLQCHSVTEVADILGSVINGYGLSCLVLYAFGDMRILESHTYYWMVFCLVLPSAAVLSFPLSRRGAIVSTALQGSFFMSITLLFMFDGNIHYAVINNWRRLKDTSFTYAIINPHLDIVDCFCIVVWLMAFISSIFIQTRLMDGGCPCWRRQRVRVLRYRDQEAQPLIARLTARELGSDDVFLSPRSNSRFMQYWNRQSLFV
uniref:TM7S3/TM198-like domain-containing protein n=1 Tax=Lutzomyia longipalpis TaxID=7200 RepID=A0A1B0GHL9_LUTLO